MLPLTKVLPAYPSHNGFIQHAWGPISYEGSGVKPLQMPCLNQSLNTQRATAPITLNHPLQGPWTASLGKNRHSGKPTIGQLPSQLPTPSFHRSAGRQADQRYRGQIRRGQQGHRDPGRPVCRLWYGLASRPNVYTSPNHPEPTQSPVPRKHPGKSLVLNTSDD